MLKQRNFLTTQIFEITDKSLKTTIKKPLSYFETEFSFEEIGGKIRRIKKPHIPTLIGFFAGVLITVVLFFSWKENSKDMPLSMVIIALFLTICNAIGFVSLYENFTNLYLHDGRFISFYARKSKINDVNAFIELLLKERKSYLLRRYAKVDPYLSIEQLTNNLQWLRTRDIIDDSEFEEYRIKILGRPNGGTSMGFIINPANN